MDASRFDRLSRSLASRASRRRAVQGLGGGGLLAVAAHGIGLNRPGATAQESDEEICSLDLVASVRVGPSEDAILGGETEGELHGDLRFTLGENGRVLDGVFTLEDGTELEASGHATGQAITVRIEIPLVGTLVLVGAGARALRSCDGAVDGLLTGPEPGDLGDWHATASVVSEPVEENSGPIATVPSSGSGAAPTSAADCLPPNAECEGGDTCCVGDCVNGFCPCAVTGMVCAGNEECCNPASGPCIGGVCACAGLGTNCFPGTTECCDELICVTGACFRENGSACTSEDECVNYCTNGICSDEPPPPACKEIGETCQTNEECCTAYCDPAGGGTCALEGVITA